ncbi:unnamed protein product [Leuciscus chuanchicus]
MSSKRFRLMKRLVHFNDNTQITGTIDQFFKVRPMFSHLNAVFRSKTTLEAHGVPLTPEQTAMGVTSQIVSVLASTMSSSTTTAIFADNFFTSLEIVRYLKDKNCRYTGTARDNRIGKPPLKIIKEMENKAVPRGTYDYVTSDDGILALRWKDNRIVTLLSTDMGAEPISSVYRYCSETKRKEQVSCPAVIKSYNANMGGIDKSDMLVHLYRTPMKSKRWYMRMFAYSVDISLTNAWVFYRRDCKAIGFLDGLYSGKLAARGHSHRIPEGAQHLKAASALLFAIPTPVRGHRSTNPAIHVRFDMSLFHAPVYTNRQTCKYCSRKGNIMRSNVVCRVCKVHLCLNAGRNCFLKYHEAVA